MSYTQLETHLKQITKLSPFQFSNQEKRKDEIKKQYSYYRMILQQLDTIFDTSNQISNHTQNQTSNQIKQFLETPSISNFINQFFINLVENEIEPIFNKIYRKVIKSIKSNFKSLSLNNKDKTPLGIWLLIKLSQYDINRSREIYHNLFIQKNPICKDIMYETKRLLERMRNMKPFSPLHYSFINEQTINHQTRIKKFQKYQLYLIHNTFFELNYDTIQNMDHTKKTENTENTENTEKIIFIKSLISNEKSIKYGFIFKNLSNVFLTSKMQLNERYKIFRKFIGGLSKNRK